MSQELDHIEPSPSPSPSPEPAMEPEFISIDEQLDDALKLANIRLDIIAQLETKLKIAEKKQNRIEFIVDKKLYDKDGNFDAKAALDNPTHFEVSYKRMDDLGLITKSEHERILESVRSEAKRQVGDLKTLQSNSAVSDRAWKTKLKDEKARLNRQHQKEEEKLKKRIEELEEKVNLLDNPDFEKLQKEKLSVERKCETLEKEINELKTLKVKKKRFGIF